MASSSLSPPPWVPPPSIPPDLLFLHPISESSGPSSSVSCSGSPLSELELSLPQCSGLPLIPAVLVPPAEKLAPLWVSKFKSSFQLLSKLASPSFSDDGTPTVRAPDSVILKSSQQWKGYLVAHFHGSPPAPSKIFSDLNPIWGKQGRISVKNHSKGICLIFIPCEITRQWVLDVGFWQSGNCSFTVTLWSPSIDLAPMKLVHAPIWVLFRHIPPELWSIEGFSTIASGVGFPVHSESPVLKPYSNGIIKLKVVVELARKRSSTIRVTDKIGNYVVISAEYPRLPPKCCLCGEFGHFQLRCPATVAPPDHIAPQAAITPGTAPLMAKGSSPLSVSVPAESSTDSPQAQPIISLMRSTSLPSGHEVDSDGIAGSSSDEWTYVARRSKPPLPAFSDSARQTSVLHVTSSQFGKEEDLIKAAQLVIRNRHAPTFAGGYVKPSGISRKLARKEHRSRLFQLSTSSSGSASSVKQAPSRSVSSPSSPTAGHSQSRSVHLLRA